jgi:L-lysine exporter family protein LysE/ArgO
MRAIRLSLVRVTLTALISGLLFSLSLIVAVGAQNAFVLRQGARREHVGVVVGICAASDVVLIAAGVAGVGGVVASHHAALTVARGVGALLLLTYGALAIRRAVLRPPGATVDPRTGASRGRVVAAAFGFTWLNPAVYLDTLLLLGSVASVHPNTRWWFGLGAAIASIGWFVALGWTARLLAPLLRHPRAPRVLDSFVALVMLVTALRILPL